MRAKGNGLDRGNASTAFTLIELLTVIAIISVLAAMLTGLSGVAASKMRTHRINGELAQLVTAIEGYKAELGFYPPDNQNALPQTDAGQILKAQLNPLYFELTGATYDNGSFTALDQMNPVNPTALTTAFGVDGIANSARKKVDVKFQTVRFRASQYAHVKTPQIRDLDNIYLLTVPVNGPTPFMVDSIAQNGGNGGKVNVWLYDATSTNRHNMASFDIWAVYNIGNRIVTNGNWR